MWWLSEGYTYTYQQHVLSWAGESRKCPVCVCLGQTPVAKISSCCIVLVVLSKYCALLACDPENRLDKKEGKGRMILIASTGDLFKACHLVNIVSI